MSAWNPELVGALCDRCILRDIREGDPVPPEVNPGATMLLIGERPGRDETRHLRPFVGRAGEELQLALVPLGIQRGHVSIDNAQACMPLAGQMGLVEARLAKVNAERTASGLEPMLHPVDACRPRLLRVVREHAARGVPNVVCLGKAAVESITELTKPIGEVRGGPIEGVLALTDKFYIEPQRPPGGEVNQGSVLAHVPGTRLRVLPTFNPAFVGRKKRWRSTLAKDIGKAQRWFRGDLQWRNPPTLYVPSPQQLWSFLSDESPYWSFDFETDDLEPLWAKVRCISIARRGINGPECVVVPLNGIDGSSHFYSPPVEAEVWRLVRLFLSSDRWLKVGWNCLFTGTPVILADGSSMPIERIVGGKLPVRVKGLSRDGRIVDADVVGWVSEFKPDQDWIVIELDGMKKHARGLTLTPDHEVYTARGRVRADDVVVGDCILTDEPDLTGDALCAVLGTLLGDSKISVSPTQKERGGKPYSAAIVLGHVVESGLTRDKVRHLRQINFTAGNYKSKGGYGPHTMAVARSSAMRQIAAVLPRLYDADGSRRLRLDVLNDLGAVGLAWWFMDDGNLGKRHDGKDRMELALCRYPDADKLAAQKWFIDRYGHHVTLDKRGSLRFSRKASLALAAEIAPHVLPSARYKLPRFVPWAPYVKTSEPPRPLAVRVRAVRAFALGRDSTRQRQIAGRRYCLTTTTGNFFTAFGLVKNCGYYDRLVAKTQLGVDVVNHVDGILLMKNTTSELPKTLAFAGSIFTDVHAWKGNHTAVNAKTDFELWAYGSLDACVTWLVIEPLWRNLQARQQQIDANERRRAATGREARNYPSQQSVVDLDHRLQSWCVGLHENGIWVDQARRAKWNRDLLAKARAAVKKLRDLAGNPLFGKGKHKLPLNPNSPHQIRAVVFDRWGLSPKAFTDAGASSVSDDVIRAFMRDKSVKDEQREFFRQLRWARRWTKYRGTFVNPVRKPGTPVEALDLSFNEDLELTEDMISKGDKAVWRQAQEAMAELRRRVMGKSAKDAKASILFGDGRVHGHWSAHSVVSGRLASSEPNMQNQPSVLRDIYAAMPGRVLVYADMDQLELRYSSAVARASRYLEVFAKGGDPHTLTSEMVFGAVFRGAGADDRKRMRDFAKRFVYAACYGSQPETILEVLTSVENKKGELVYENLKLEQARERRANWLAGNPGFERWWTWQKAEFREQGYLQELATGRRRDFLDLDNENEWINFVIQGGGAGIVNSATRDLVDGPGAPLAFQRWGPGTGLVQQGHDALMFEVPLDLVGGYRPGDKVVPLAAYRTAIAAAKAVQEAMHRRVVGLDVEFTASAKVILCDDTGLSRWGNAGDDALAVSPYKLAA